MGKSNMTDLIGESFTVPGNSSRFFTEKEIAINQTKGKIQLACIIEDPYIYNSEFDAQIIKYDEQYCTTVTNIDNSYLIPTLSYIDKVLANFDTLPFVIDIGCGQGELVRALTHLGLDVVGFDPVLRKATSKLHKRMWSNSEQPADLYVMRCVLPHIPNPWDFLSQIWESSPNSFILIEFQRIEWIIENKVWYQLSHDHVNIFSLNDFFARYEVLEDGTFGFGEWGWVLLKNSKFKNSNIEFEVILKTKLSELLIDRITSISQLKELNKNLAIWGAAGKGIVLSSALSDSGLSILAIDADKNRQGLYLESSGSYVISPEEARDGLDKNTLILVSNPNHLVEIKNFMKNDERVHLPSDYL
jgi:SAM-dependent methyltransferase